MKCIDAIEGTVKSILNQVYRVSTEDIRDDSEYVRNVKAVIDATDDYLATNPELIEDPKLLKNVLYVYSRNLWLMNAPAISQSVPAKIKELSCETEEYQTYYYDYLYHHGVYPR